MQKYIYLYLAGLLLCGLSSCFYSDSEIYQGDPVPGDPPLVSVSTNLDSLINPPVNDSLQVSYLVDITGGEFYYMYADLIDRPVFESDSTEGSFWINRFMADSVGVDTLYLEFYYSSNTNSLADKVGYEARVVFLDYAIDFNLNAAR